MSHGPCDRPLPWASRPVDDRSLHTRHRTVRGVHRRARRTPQRTPRRRARTPRGPASSPGVDLGALVDELVEQVAPDSADDIAVLGARPERAAGEPATDGRGAEQAERGEQERQAVSEAPRAASDGGSAAGTGRGPNGTDIDGKYESFISRARPNPRRRACLPAATLRDRTLDGLGGDHRAARGVKPVSDVVVHVGRR